MNISNISINNTNTPGISYRGKFILSKNLSKDETQIIESVNKMVINKKSNNRILKRLPFDIFIDRNKKFPELLELRTNFTDIFANKKRNCFISFIHADGKHNQIDVLDFRRGLKWFDEYKKHNFGFNSAWEKLKLKLNLQFMI